MRTTVSIDDQVLARVKDLARSSGRTLGQVVEASLIDYLARPAPRVGPPLPVFAAGGGLLPGIDPSSNTSMFEAADGDVDTDALLR